MRAGNLLHKAVLARLLANAALTSAIGANRVFDAVPYNQPFPFTVIGEMTSTDWSTGTEQGAEHALVVHIWSRSGGKRQAFEAASAIYDALHEADLPLAGHHLVNLRHQSTDVRRAEDGETFHGVMRFRAVTESSIS